MPRLLARRAALSLALLSPLGAAAACGSDPTDPKPPAGLYVQITDNNAADVHVLGCPQWCGTTGAGIVSGTEGGWFETRVGIAYTIIVSGRLSACPPVLPRTRSSHGIYYVVTATGACELSTRPRGEHTPE